MDKREGNLIDSLMDMVLQMILNKGTGTRELRKLAYPRRRIACM
jgi:hypothetical protein